MLDQLTSLEQAALTALQAVSTSPALEQWRVTHLGRSAPLMTLLGDLGKLPKEERPAAGQAPRTARHASAAGGTRQAALGAYVDPRLSGVR